MKAYLKPISLATHQVTAQAVVFSVICQRLFQFPKKSIRDGRTSSSIPSPSFSDLVFTLRMTIKKKTRLTRSFRAVDSIFKGDSPVDLKRLRASVSALVHHERLKGHFRLSALLIPATTVSAAALLIAATITTFTVLTD